MKQYLSFVLCGMLLACSGTYAANSEDPTKIDKQSVATVTEPAERSYPETKRFFSRIAQQNRYLQCVTAFSELMDSQVIFNASTQEELPFTYYGVANEIVTDGAVIDKTSVPVLVEEGSSSFDLKFEAWTNPVRSEGGIFETELVWTYQAYFIDWNNDYEFFGPDEIGESVGTASSDNNFGDPAGSLDNGWKRTFPIPENIKPGTYRMRVVYAEYDNDMNWPEILYTDLLGYLQNGVAYDFSIEVVASGPVLRIVNPENGGRLKVTDEKGGEITEGTMLEVGSKIVIEAIPDDYYFVTSMMVNGEEQTVVDNTCTVEVTGRMVVSAEFDAYTCTIPQENSEGAVVVKRNGTPLFDGSLIKSGEELVVSMEAGLGYAPCSLNINGEEVSFLDIKEKIISVDGDVVLTNPIFVEGNMMYIEVIGEGEVEVIRDGVKLENQSTIFMGDVLSIKPITSEGYVTSGIYMNDDYEYNWLEEAPASLQAYKVSASEELNIVAEFVVSTGLGNVRDDHVAIPSSFGNQLIVSGELGTSVVITDMAGIVFCNLVLDSENLSIPTSSWAAGLYIVKVGNKVAKSIKY